MMHLSENCKCVRLETIMKFRNFAPLLNISGNNTSYKENIIFSGPSEKCSIFILHKAHATQHNSGSREENCGIKMSHSLEGKRQMVPRGGNTSAFTATMSSLLIRSSR